ncbi:MAG: hypothetical protein R3195_14320 [Gemmatimonadota bacterium]|nr:hypothetical protein [Gemmatimonadota bacterium]
MATETEPRAPRETHRLYVHVAWTTLARVPVIPPERCAAIETHMMAACRQLGAEPVEARALVDRIHLIVRLPVVASVAAVAKGVRAEVAERLERSGRVVRWSPGFAAVTITPADVRRARKRLAAFEDPAVTPRDRGRAGGAADPPGG